MRHLTKHLVVALIAISTFLPVLTQAQVGITTEADQIKQAQKHFDAKNYAQALPLYSQIVSNQPDNAIYNYYLGVCLLQVDGDKADAVRFLTIAKQSSDVPINVWLYLGMALHQAYRFDEAITTLQTYRKGAGKQGWKDAGGEQLVQMCRNAINQNNDLSLPRHSILKEQETNCVDFVTSYKNIAAAGRFLKLPKEYESKQSKEKAENKLLFLTAKGDMMVFAGSGKSGQTGSDIFLVTKDAKGLWRFPETISPLINSTDDEAYPVLVNDGKTVYFSSKGEKSIGGYDVFRSDFDQSTSSWSEPVSMGSPVNSPGNDFYYVPLADNKTAYFSSDRESPTGKCKVYTASIIYENRNFVAINGTFVCPAGLDLSDAKVTILNSGDRSLLAQFRTSTQNGTYLLKLPVPSQLIYQVKLPGFNDLEAEVNLTDENRAKLLQEILVKRDDKGKESIRITTKVPEVLPELMVKNAVVPETNPQQIAATKLQSNETLPSEKSTTTPNTATLPLVSIVNAETKEVAAITPEKKMEPVKAEPVMPLVSIVNTETKEVAAVTTEQKAEPVKTESAMPLVSIENTETKEVAAITTEKKMEPVKTESVMPLVSIVNTETKEVAAVTTEKKMEPVKAESVMPLVSIVNTEPKEVASITPEKKSESVKTESAMPLVSIVNTETKEVAAITTEKTAEPVKTESAMPLVSIVNIETKDVAAITPEKKVEPVKVEVNTAPSPVANKQPIVKDAKIAESNAPVATVIADSKNDKALPLESVIATVPAEVSASNNSNGEVAGLPDSKRKSRRSKHDEAKAPVAVETPAVQVAKTQVKPTMQDVIFKVQLGAFRDRTEAELKKKFVASGIKNLEYIKNSEGLLVVVTGHETDYLSATKLKETAIQKGLKDAFVVVYSGDNRLPVSMVVFEDEE